MEAIEEDRIAFHFGVRNLNGDQASGTQVSALENRGHAAACRNAFNLVVIELFAGVDGNPRERGLV
jgi:hypothetical protein